MLSEANRALAAWNRVTDHICYPDKRLQLDALVSDLNTVREVLSAISRAEGLGVEGGLKEGIAVSRTIQSSPSGDPQARLSDGKGEP